jgi:hypothetical protein
VLSRLAYSSFMKMEAVYSSETSVDLYKTARRYIPDNGITGSLLICTFMFLLGKLNRKSEKASEKEEILTNISTVN